MNEGIFITKNGVALPVPTEMAASNLAGYQANLTLPLIKNTNHEFNAFEFFKFRGYINESGVIGGFTFNGSGNYTPSYITGAGSLDTSNGRITPSSVPLAVEKANRIYQTGAIMAAEQLASGDDIALRLASIDGLATMLINIDTKAYAFVNPIGTNDESTTLVYTEPETIKIRIDADAIVVLGDADVVLHSLPRSYHVEVLTGAVGILTSSGTATGDELPFDETDILDTANIVGNGTIKVVSSFGQQTTYTVKLGTALGAETPNKQLSFNASNAATYDVNDDLVGGVGTKSYTIHSGQIPPGMSLNSSGILGGTPTVDGDYTIVVRTTDEFSSYVDIQYDISVVQGANVDYNPHPATVDEEYQYTPPSASKSAGAEVTEGAYPAGMSLDAVTGELTGTPEVAGTYDFVIQVTLEDDTVESIPVSLIVYDSLVATLETDGETVGEMDENVPIEATLSAEHQIIMSGGSGSFQYSITGSNTINSDGVMQIYETGEVEVTVTDIVTGITRRFVINASGQTDICGMAVETENVENSDSAPCVDIITDCSTPITVAFQGLHILRGIESTDVPYREYPKVINSEGMTVQQSGKPFAMLRSKAANAFAIADNAKDGKPFIVEFAVGATLANATTDFLVGVSKDFAASKLLQNLDFALAITTVSGVRKVEIRQGNVYQAGSRVTIAEGQQVGLAVFPDAVYLYVDGILKFSLTSTTFACRGLEIVFYATVANMIIGGKIGNIIYDIATAGLSSEVGTLDPQTGHYVPSPTNVGLVEVTGSLLVATPDLPITILYRAKIRVISGAPKRSLERAMIEGIPVDVYIADSGRADDLPLRLDRDGRPDKNQFSDPEHLGTLAGSGKMEPTSTRQDFRNDRGATSSSLVFDKIVVSGGFLGVRDFGLVKRLVPYMKELNRGGVRSLRQYSTGCHKRMRVILIWQTAECDDVPVFDAIEFGNALSYTTFALEVGQGVQSNLPLAIEAFPDKDGILFEYFQFDKHFHRIGA